MSGKDGKSLGARIQSDPRHYLNNVALVRKQEKDRTLELMSPDSSPRVFGRRPGEDTVREAAKKRATVAHLEVALEVQREKNRQARDSSPGSPTESFSRFTEDGVPDYRDDSPTTKKLPWMSSAALDAKRITIT